MSFASRREGEGVEFEEGEGSGLLADRGQGTLKHLIQFELSKKESPLKEAVVEVRRMQGLRGWGCCLEGDPMTGSAVKCFSMNGEGVASKLD